MRQLLQNLKSGDLSLVEVAAPQVDEQSVLVQNHHSLISAGTEKTKLELGQKSLLQKARARPEQVKKVIESVKSEGLAATYQKVNARLDQPSPLGYSCAGTVIETGSRVRGIKPGDRVACAGAGYANHAETVAIPQNLVAKIPDNVATEQAAFSTVGAIALQGLRNAEPQMGECFLVIGLGLIGQITVQLLLANGCGVIATDPDQHKLSLAQAQGAYVTDGSKAYDFCLQVTDNHGVDGVLICASTQSSQPVQLAGQASRERGRVVAVGAVGLDLPREPYYQKEIQFSVARSYGPGRYDSEYEEKGHDYPFSYVRFTENRNMQTFLQLLSQNSIDMTILESHRYNFDEALKAYELLNSDQHYLGILFEYDSPNKTITTQPLAKHIHAKPGTVRIVMAGSGQYATSVLLPVIKSRPEMLLNRIMTARGYTAEHIAKQYGFYEACDNMTRLLADDCDLLMVLTQHHQHADMVRQGLNAGKHVYVEKPLAIQQQALKQVYNSYQQHNGLLWVGFNRRFAPLISKMQQFYRPVDGPKMINIEVNAGPIPSNHWIHDPERGGGRIIGEACHFIDLAHAIAQSEPVSVYTRGLPSTTQSAMTNDNVLINLAFADGSIANITYTAHNAPGMPKERVSAHSRGRSAILHDFCELWLYDNGPKAKKHKLKRRDKGQKGMMEALVKSINSGHSQLDPQAVFASSLAAIKACESLAVGASLPVNMAELQSQE